MIQWQRADANRIDERIEQRNGIRPAGHANESASPGSSIFARAA